jgi:hypothetical protein
MLNIYFFLIEYELYLDIIRSIFVIFLDYSSGYESSSGSSDNETQASIKQTLSLSQLDKIWKEQNQHATKEKMKYQNTSALCSHLRYIISMPELCDVTFLVGSRCIPVYGVKAIMGTRSR